MQTPQTPIFKIKDVCFDKERKEYVQVSNLRCPICAQGNKHPDVFNRRHPVQGVECATEAFEAIALRITGISKQTQRESLRPRVRFAYTYVSVKVENLSFAPEGKSIFERAFTHPDFEGRI